jgi:hypothetical protein
MSSTTSCSDWSQSRGAAGGGTGGVGAAAWAGAGEVLFKFLVFTASMSGHSKSKVQSLKSATETESQIQEDTVRQKTIRDK